MDGWTDGRAGGRTEGWMDGWMDGRTVQRLGLGAILNEKLPARLWANVNRLRS